MDANSAEAVKLFANSYLAMRTLNELDPYCEINDINSRDVIEGIDLILELEIIITIHLLVTEVIVFQKILSNY